MGKTQIKGSLILLLVSFIWGMGFVAQKLGMDNMPPFCFNGIRSILGAAVLIPVILIFSRAKARSAPSQSSGKGGLKLLVTGGIVCGACMAIASNLQQIGLIYTTAGKAGFITAMYILIVPFLGIFTGKKIRPFFLVFLVMAVAGLYLLCINGEFSLGTGDGLELLCAFFFSLHILSIDFFVARVDAVKLSAIQLFVNGVISLLISLFTERVSAEGFLLAMPAILYAGLCSSGVGYTLQVVGQKMVQPAVASLIMSLESVFSVLGGALIMHDIMSGREIAGCVIMFASIILLQIYESREKKGKTDHAV